ncbi:MAG: sugar phosphate isomerase/epimerase [Ignavibacteriales bacterium]|nr:sugar phosphate isomerase/epimerase [Ignavibacteriales bacterium]
MRHSRRNFLKLAGLSTAIGSLPLSAVFPKVKSADKAPILFTLGIASYTFRSFTLDQAIEMTKRLGITKLTLKDMHLPVKSTEEEIKAGLEKMKAAGVELSSCGVVYMTTEEEVRRAFAYAKAAGIRMLVGVPEEPLLPLAERMVKETDISLAIHNHGPTDKRYPSPESAYKLIAKMDKRMGLCIDVGHTRRLGVDPADDVERFFDRLLDVHMKDVSDAEAKGTTVECGRGVIDIPKLLKTLVKLKYAGALHFEHEKDQKDPLPGVAESVGYVRGVLATL